MAQPNEGKVAARYNKLSILREPYLQRARECSALTIPHLLPEDGHNKSASLPTPYQAVGARGVNNLAAKMLLATLPANTPFFRYSVDDFALQEMTGQEGMRGEVEEALGQIERAVMSEINNSDHGYRIHIHESLKHLVVGGNALLYLPKDGGSRVFHLDRYVTRRDPSGTVLEIITVEYLTRDTLPKDVRDQMPPVQGDPQAEDKDIPMYTRVWRDVSRKGNAVWKVEQEVESVSIEASKGTYPIDKTPWLPLRWTKIDNEDYGRGYVEEYLGDLKSLEGLTKAIVQASAIASKVVFLNKPNGVTKTKKLAQAESGDIIDGKEEDVAVLQVGKQGDLRTAQDTARQMTERLGYAFMLASQSVRQAERVTAEEIRFLASELEDALGGVYSVLSQELQLPFVGRIIDGLTAKGRIPKLPKGVVQPVIVTGIEALGRGHDISSLRAAAEDIAIMAKIPPEVGQRIDFGELLSRIFTARGIDAKGLVKDEQAMQEQQQQEQAMQMAQSLGPEAMRQGGKMMEQAQPPEQEITNG